MVFYAFTDFIFQSLEDFKKIIVPIIISLEKDSTLFIDEHPFDSEIKIIRFLKNDYCFALFFFNETNKAIDVEAKNYILDNLKYDTKEDFKTIKEKIIDSKSSFRFIISSDNAKMVFDDYENIAILINESLESQLNATIILTIDKGKHKEEFVSW